MAGGLGGCMSCIKYCLFAFNLLFWLIGCALVGVGIWIVVDTKRFMQVITDNIDANLIDDLGQTEEALRIVGFVAIGIGAVILILGFLGCCGAIRESQCLLTTFFILLLVIFLILIAAGIFVFAFSDKMRDLVKTALEEEVDRDVQNGILNYANGRYDCCGVEDQVGGICSRQYPPRDKCNPLAIGACQRGCLDEIWNDFENMRTGLGIALLVAGGVTLIGMVFSMCLCCSLRDSYSSY